MIIKWRVGITIAIYDRRVIIKLAPGVNHTSIYLSRSKLNKQKMSWTWADKCLFVFFKTTTLWPLLLNKLSRWPLHKLIRKFVQCSFRINHLLLSTIFCSVRTLVLNGKTFPITGIRTPDDSNVNHIDPLSHPKMMLV